MKHFENEQELDALLSQPGQQVSASAVKLLHDEQPSLVWRSGLNERVLQAAGKAKAKKARVQWFWAGGASFAALALAAVVLFNPSASIDSKSDANSGTLEAQMVQAFQEDKVLREETSINQVALNSVGAQHTVSTDFSEEATGEEI